MDIEKRSSGVYYKCIFHLTEYEAAAAAVRTLRWYLSYLNRQLDPSRYSFFLTHTECLLQVKIKEKEWTDINFREQIFARADEIIGDTKKEIEMLSKGIVPEKIKSAFQKEVEDISKEW